MRKFFLCLFLFLISFFLVNTAHATLYNFDSGTDGFTTYGTATGYSGSVQLTAPATGQYGSIFTDATLDATNFNASFDFRLSEPNAPYRADGITFAWVKSPGLGGGGGDLGFHGLDGYMVEFDTYWNVGYDSAASHLAYDHTNHIAFGTDVNYDDQFALENVSSPDFVNSVWHHVNINFYNGHIEVSLDGTGYIDYIINDYSGFEAYFGFTGATGASYSRQVIDNFEITTNQPVPEPATMFLLGSGLISLVGFRRKFRKK